MTTVKHTKRGPILTVPEVRPKRGRPPLPFTDELAKEICLRIKLGETVWSICNDTHMPSETVMYEWLAEKPGFADNYARARTESADRSSDKILEIAAAVTRGELAPDAGRVAIDAHKWSAGKRKPKVYGDRLELAGSVNIGLADRLERARTRKA